MWVTVERQELGQTKLASRCHRFIKIPAVQATLGEWVRLNCHSFIGPMRNLHFRKAVGQDDVRQFMGQRVRKPVDTISPDINPPHHDSIFVEINQRRAGRLARAGPTSFR